MSLLEISIRSLGGHIVFKLDCKEYSAVARLEHENGDVGQMMLQIRLIVSSVKGVVGEDVVEPSKPEPTVSIRGYGTPPLRTEGLSVLPTLLRSRFLPRFQRS